MAITGSLPIEMLKNNNMLEYLLLSNNQISGTISELAFKDAIQLSYLLISDNSISGSLPEQQLEVDSSARRRKLRHYGADMATGFPLSLTTLLANDLKLSGSLPQLIGAENRSTFVNQQQKPIKDAFSLMSSPPRY